MERPSNAAAPPATADSAIVRCSYFGDGDARRASGPSKDMRISTCKQQARPANPIGETRPANPMGEPAPDSAPERSHPPCSPSPPGPSPDMTTAIDEPEVRAVVMQAVLGRRRCIPAGDAFPPDGAAVEPAATAAGAPASAAGAPAASAADALAASAADAPAAEPPKQARPKTPPPPKRPALPPFRNPALDTGLCYCQGCYAESRERALHAAAATAARRAAALARRAG